MNNNKYEDYMTQNHIKIFTIEEIIADSVPQVFDYPILEKVDNVKKSFNKVFVFFDKSPELLQNCHARNAFEEAALHNLRFEMERLYYQVKEDFPGKDLFERTYLSNSMKYIISIFIIIPNIMYDKTEDEIFNYAVDKDLLFN